jgi:hypothetical protein
MTRDRWLVHHDQDRIWFYEISPLARRKIYSKTKPMSFEEFSGCRPQ